MIQLDDNQLNAMRKYFLKNFSLEFRILNPVRWDEIQRRLLPQGILLDPELHVFHGTPQQAVDAVMSTGRYTPPSAEAAL